MAKKFGKVSVSDDVTEREDEAGDERSDALMGAPTPKTTTGARPGDGGGGKPLFARMAQFLRDTRAEMRRVSWPTLVMVRNTTLITLVAVVFFAVYLFAVDRIWTFLIDNLRAALGG